MLCDMPYKFTNSFTFVLPLYFLSNLRREVDAFFIFWFFSIITTLTMSMIFRTMGAASRSLSQALVPAAIFILGLVIYTGFVIPTRDMLGWSRWMNYVNPVGYAFESLLINEFTDRMFKCAAYIPSGPGYENVPDESRICATVSATAGATEIDGAAYLATSYNYLKSNLWRNVGIIFAFMIFFMFVYLFATEYISEAMSKGEVLIFRRGHQPKHSDDEETSTTTAGAATKQGGSDEKGDGDSVNIQRQTAIFHWQDLSYDIKIKGEGRRILDQVDGWVKPGTATVLMVRFFSVLIL